MRGRESNLHKSSGETSVFPPFTRRQLFDFLPLIIILLTPARQKSINSNKPQECACLMARTKLVSEPFSSAMLSPPVNGKGNALQESKSRFWMQVLLSGC